LRLPRNVSGTQLAKALGKLGYVLVHQTGSHMRLTRRVDEEHHLTIPRHKPLKVGTLNGILKDVAEHLAISRLDLLELLFGK